MTKDRAKELLEEFKGASDNEVLNIITSSTMWYSYNISKGSPTTLETYTIKQLKEIAND
jgi:hypothetical protein